MIAWEHVPKAIKECVISSWALEEVAEIDMHRLGTDAVIDNILIYIPTKYVYVIVHSRMGSRIEKLFDQSVEGWKIAEFGVAKKESHYEKPEDV